MDKKIQIAVIGCGLRAKHVVKNLLRDSSGNVNVAAVYDPDQAVVESNLEYWTMPEARRCADYQEAISTPSVEWVMVFSPNAFHKEQVTAAFAAGKHVFSEKPLATSIEDCIAINQAHQASGKLFATGFVLRYAPIYRKAYELLQSGQLGRIIAVEANENIPPQHGAYIMRNWRRHTALSGPHILEKCCHDLDLIEWLTGSLPLKIMAFGGQNFYLPENAHLTRLVNPSAASSLQDPHAVESPFTGGGDLMDNLVSIAEFRDQLRVSFCCSMSNPLPERRMYFSCTQGTMRLDLYQGLLNYRILGENVSHTLDFSCDGHGGGDAFIMKELYETMISGTLPKCSGREGLLSAVYALAIDEAARTGQIVDLQKIWQQLEV